MLFRPATILSLFAACAAVAAPAPAMKEVEDPNAPVSYFKKVRPIFQAQCQGCHQPAKAKGGYVMTDFARLLKGGDSGDAAILAGHADKSPLVAAITPK